MQRGGGSKDTWVLSDGPVDTFSLQRPRDLPVELNRGILAIFPAAPPTTFSGSGVTQKEVSTCRACCAAFSPASPVNWERRTHESGRSDEDTRMSGVSSRAAHQ